MADTMDGIMSTINRKIQLLTLVKNETEDSEQGMTRPRDVARLIRTFETQLAELHELKLRAQEAMLSSDDKPEQISKWTAEFTKGVTTFERSLDHLQEIAENMQRESEWVTMEHVENIYVN